jgi:hypothetical protein
MRSVPGLLCRHFLHKLHPLMMAAFVIKPSLWSFKMAKPLKQSLYRISDLHMRFYLKVLEPNLEAMLQLDAFLFQNRPLLIQTLGISPVDIVRHGPDRQAKTTTQQGCPIDYPDHDCHARKGSRAVSFKRYCVQRCHKVLLLSRELGPCV